jgi:hypothetical protein
LQELLKICQRFLYRIESPEAAPTGFSGNFALLMYCVNVNNPEKNPLAWNNLQGGFFEPKKSAALRHDASAAPISIQLPGVRGAPKALA